MSTNEDRAYLIKPQLEILVFLFFSPTGGLARQVPGRPTLPSDCTPQEHWVRDHSKSTGSWTAFCRINPSGNVSKSYKFWASKFQHGRPEDWPYSEERTTNWESKDVADTLWALERIPVQLWDSTLRGIYRMNKSIDPSNPGADWEGHVVLYDPAFQNERYLERVLAHEFTHEKFMSLSTIQRADYAISSGWKAVKSESGKQVFEAPKCCFVQPDGGQSIEEDFANNVEYFYMSPVLFESLTPKPIDGSRSILDPALDREMENEILRYLFDNLFIGTCFALQRRLLLFKSGRRVA